MTVSELRIMLNLPASTQTKSVYNHAIRRLTPGGTEVMDTLTRLMEMQHGRNHPDPALADMITDLARARDKMIDVIRDSHQ